MVFVARVFIFFLSLVLPGEAMLNPHFTYPYADRSVTDNATVTEVTSPTASNQVTARLVTVTSANTELRVQGNTAGDFAVGDKVAIWCRYHGGASGFGSSTGRWDIGVVSSVTDNNGDGTSSLALEEALSESLPGTSQSSSAETYVVQVPEYDVLNLKAPLTPTSFGFAMVRAREINFRSGSYINVDGMSPYTPGTGCGGNGGSTAQGTSCHGTTGGGAAYTGSGGAGGTFTSATDKWDYNEGPAGGGGGGGNSITGAAGAGPSGAGGAAYGAAAMEPQTSRVTWITAPGGAGGGGSGMHRRNRYDWVNRDCNPHECRCSFSAFGVKFGCSTCYDRCAYWEVVATVGPSSGGSGAKGGGVIILMAEHIRFMDVGTYISAKGLSGSGGSGSRGGGGGGGAGGSILIAARNVTHFAGANTVRIAGGAGGSGSSAGGAGAAGRLQMACGWINDHECDTAVDRDGGGDIIRSMVDSPAASATFIDFVDRCPEDDDKYDDQVCGCNKREPYVPDGFTVADNTKGCRFFDEMDDNFVCVYDRVPRHDPTAAAFFPGATDDPATWTPYDNTPCAICMWEVSNPDNTHSREWSSRKDTCYIDGICYADGVDKVYLATGRTTYCEHCNRSLDHNEWASRDLTCRVPWDESDFGYDPDLPYLCLKHTEQHPSNLCEECNSTPPRTDLTKVVTNPGDGHFVDNSNNCTLRDFCTDADHCHAGHCVRWLATETSVDPVNAHPTGSYQQDDDPDGDLLGVAIRVLRPGGVRLTHLGAPGDFANANAADAEVTVHLTDYSSGKVVASAVVSGYKDLEDEEEPPIVAGGYTYATIDAPAGSTLVDPLDGSSAVHLPFGFLGAIHVDGAFPTGGLPSHSAPKAMLLPDACEEIQTGTREANDLRLSLIRGLQGEWNLVRDGTDPDGPGGPEGALFHASDPWFTIPRVLEGGMGRWTPRGVSARAACRAARTSTHDEIVGLARIPPFPGGMLPGSGAPAPWVIRALAATPWDARSVVNTALYGLELAWMGPQRTKEIEGAVRVAGYVARVPKTPGAPAPSVSETVVAARLEGREGNLPYSGKPLLITRRFVHPSDDDVDETPMWVGMKSPFRIGKSTLRCIGADMVVQVFVGGTLRIRADCTSGLEQDDRVNFNGDLGDLTWGDSFTVAISAVGAAPGVGTATDSVTGLGPRFQSFDFTVFDSYGDSVVQFVKEFYPTEPRFGWTYAVAERTDGMDVHTALKTAMDPIPEIARGRADVIGRSNDVLRPGARGSVPPLGKPGADPDEVRISAGAYVEGGSTPPVVIDFDGTNGDVTFVPGAFSTAGGVTAGCHSTAGGVPDTPISPLWPRVALCGEEVSGGHRAAMGGAYIVVRALTISSIASAPAVAATVYAGDEARASRVCNSGSAPCVWDVTHVGHVEGGAPICIVVEPLCPGGCGGCNTWASGTASASARVTFSLEQAVLQPRVGAALAREPPKCFLDDQCIGDGVPNKANDCQVCITEESRYEWSSRIFERCNSCDTTSGGGGCTCDNTGQCLSDAVLPGAPAPPPDPLPAAAPGGAADLGGNAGPASLPDRTVPSAPAVPDPLPRPSLGFLSGSVGAARDLAKLADAATDYFDTASNPLSRFGDANAGLKTVFSTLGPLIDAASGALKFDTSGLNLNELNTIFASGKSIKDSAADDGTDAGTCAFALSDVTSGFKAVVEAIVPSLGALPEIPAPPGFPPLSALLPSGISVTFDPADPTQIAGLDLSVAIPDAEPVPGILEWTNAEASFYYSSRLLAISADVSLTLPVLNVALGTYSLSADVRFAPSFKGVPSAALRLIARAGNTGVPLLPGGILTASVTQAALDTGARTMSISAVVEADIPLIGKVGPYEGSIDVFLTRDSATAGPPASDADPDEDRDSTVVIASIEASSAAQMVDVVPGGFLRAKLESLYLHTGDSVVSFEGTAQMTLPLYGDLGTYRAQVDLNFADPNFSGDVGFHVAVENIDPQWIELVPSILEIRPLRAVVSSLDSFVDLEGDISASLPVIGSLGSFNLRMQVIWPKSQFYTGTVDASGDTGGPFSGGSPDVIVTLQSIFDPPTMVPIIPGVVEVGLVRGEVRKADGLVSIEGRVELNLPGLVDLGGYDTVVELQFEPELKGTPKIFISFIANPETPIVIIPGFVTFTLVRGVFDHGNGEVMLKGRLELPVIGEMTGVLIAKWDGGEIKGLPSEVCVYPSATPPAGGSEDTLGDAGLDSSDTEGLPLPGGLLRFYRVCLIPVEKRLVMELTGEPGEKLKLIPGFVTAYGIELHIELSFGTATDRSGRASKVVKPKRQVGGSAPSKGSSFQLSFKLLGKWTIGETQGYLEVEKNTGEFIIRGGFDRLSMSSLAKKFIGDLPDILVLAMDGFSMRDVEFAASISGGSAPSAKKAKGSRKKVKSRSKKTRLFRLAGLPDSEFIRQFIDESAKAELLTGSLGGKAIFAFVSSIKVDKVLAFIGDRIGFPALTNLPFPGESPLRLGYCNAALDYQRNPELSFGTVQDPPALLRGVGFGMNMLKPSISCPGPCEKMMSVIAEAFQKVSASVSVSVLKPTVRFKAALSLSLDVILFKLEEISFNLVVPIPNLSKLQIYLEAITEILFAFTYWIPLEFQIGYRNLKVYGSGFSDKLFPLWGMPFWNVGRVFGEVELGLKNVAGAIGGEMLLGLNCLDERGQEKDDSGCFLVRAALGIGIYQYIYFESDVIDFEKILGMLGLNLDPFPLKSFGALIMASVTSSYSLILMPTGRSAWSWAGGEDRVLPNGVEIPVGFRVAGSFLMFLMFQVDLEIILPITPTMIIAIAASVLSYGSLAATMIKLIISEFLNGYTFKIKGSMPAWDILGGVVNLWVSKSDPSKGPMIDMEIFVRPLSFPPIGWKWIQSGYINILFGVLEYEVKIEILATGIRMSGMRSLFGIRQGMLLEILPAVQGFLSNPGSLIENSRIQVGVLFSLEDFNRLILDPLNFLVDLFLDGFKKLFGLIPVVGSIIVSVINTIQDILRARFYRIYASIILKPWSLGIIFELAARLFGFDINVNVKIAKTPAEIIVMLWEDVFLPVYNEITYLRGPPVPLGCSNSEEEFAFTCAERCRSGYTSMPKFLGVPVPSYPLCWSSCPTGAHWSEQGATCVFYHLRGPKTCTKSVGFGSVSYPCGCPSGYANFGVACLRVKIIARSTYIRLPRPVYTCENRGSWGSMEFWLIIPWCYKSCSPKHKGVFMDCIDRRFVPFSSKI